VCGGSVIMDMQLRSFTWHTRALGIWDFASRSAIGILVPQATRAIQASEIAIPAFATVVPRIGALRVNPDAGIVNQLDCPRTCRLAGPGMVPRRLPADPVDLNPWAPTATLPASQARPGHFQFRTVASRQLYPFVRQLCLMTARAECYGSKNVPVFIFRAWGQFYFGRCRSLGSNAAHEPKATTPARSISKLKLGLLYDRGHWLLVGRKQQCPSPLTSIR
jgi:hypothetical protein